MTGPRWAFVLALLGSAVALACPVCGAATDNQDEYKYMTLVMSALPLMMMGSVVGVIAFRVRKADREDEQRKKAEKDRADRKDDAQNPPPPAQ